MRKKMRKIELDQGSLEWLTWRKGLITATEAGCIMGVNPYCSVYKSWQRKIGLIAEQEETEPMRRGKRDEPIARDLFIKERGINMIPCCVESSTYNFLGASLDGLSTCGRYLLEIKSQQNFNGVLPEYHYAQMQHQMLCSDGAIEKGYYVSHWEGKNITLEVLPDHAWMKTYIEKATDYWKCVVFFESPEMQASDYRNMNCDAAWNFSAIQYKSICDKIKALEDLKETCRKELIHLCGKDNCFGAGVKVLQKVVKGRVDYELIPDLKQIDLDKYRKPVSKSWTIMLDQKQKVV